ncbi:MAG: hypothetical protein QOI58_1527 [Thermoanaerobaculia bacterium]|jgi:CHAT domain-containing protein|nr:hypothetical protein [Thermoanaerobaculia bacterium]
MSNRIFVAGLTRRVGVWLALLVTTIAAAPQRFNSFSVLVAGANSATHRFTEARVSAAVDYRPFASSGTERAPGKLLKVAADAERRWIAQPSSENARRAGAALLLSGKFHRAVAVLTQAVELQTREIGLDAINSCADAALLTDLSAAMLDRRSDGRTALLAFEAADRAWLLDPTAPAAWNRAIALDLLGLPFPAVRAWDTVLAQDSTTPWAREASARRDAAAQRHASAGDVTFEQFFESWLIDAAQHLPNAIGNGPAQSDHLASDTAVWMRELKRDDRSRATAALKAFAAAREAFDNDHFAKARAQFAVADAELTRLRSPLALLARDGWIRCECTAAEPACLRDIDTLQSQLAPTGRYPWIEARSSWSKGQTYYRRGRMYEAVTWMQHALDQFGRLGDMSSQRIMHSLLANAYAGAGESELALDHHLEAVRSRAVVPIERRRRIIDDALLFFLRHRFLSTAALLLNEESRLPSKPWSVVREERYRGILAAWRGEEAALKHFSRASALLERIDDLSARANERTNIAIAEAGTENVSGRTLADIDRAIVAHADVDNSVWLPQLLAERAQAFLRRGDRAGAEADLRRAVDTLEGRAPRIDQAMIALGAGARAQSPFDLLIRLLLDQGRVAEALEIAERASNLRISSLNGQIAGVSDVFRLRSDDDQDDRIQTMQAHLSTDEVAIVYYVLRDELITWIVTGHRITARRCLLRRQTLLNAAANVRGRGDATNTLSRLLLGDWLGTVAENATLIIVPSPELQNIPFGMLRTPAGFLIQRNAIATAPSLKAFAHAVREDAMRARAGPINAFFCAAPKAGADFPPLGRAASEAATSARQYADGVVEANSARTRFLELAPHFAVIGFAGHVLVNESQPLRSALVFNGGEMVYVHEMDRRSFARARLVVLSGCSSGRAPRPTTSVADAVLSQGVPSVVYALWPVADDVAAEFAVAFHRALTSGETRAGAVRQAQLHLLRGGQHYADDWPAFGVTGTSGRLTELRGK